MHRLPIDAGLLPVQLYAATSGQPAAPLPRRRVSTNLGAVRVYVGPGAGPGSCCQTMAALAAALAPEHPLAPIGAAELQTAAWRHSTALLVLPGGRAGAYVAALGPAGAAQIGAYVAAGGHYLGICGGAYLAAAQVDFAPSDPHLQIRASRPLGFYPGTCAGPRGGIFAYHNGIGARLEALDLHAPQTFGGRTQGTIFCYGGGSFLAAARHPQVTILATYAGASPPQAAPRQGPDGGSNQGLGVDAAAAAAGNLAGDAAIVCCAVGRGMAILSGVHPEVSATCEPTDGSLAQLGPALQAAEGGRQAIWLGLLHLLQLQLQPSATILCRGAHAGD